MKKNTNGNLEVKKRATTMTGMSQSHSSILSHDQALMKEEQKFKSLENLIRNVGETDLPQSAAYYDRLHNSIMAEIVLEPEGALEP